VLLPFLAAIAASVLVSVPPALAANNGTFSIAPASTSSFQRTYFTPVLAPGVASKDSVVVVNSTGAPLKLDLYASDAFNTASGGFALQPNFKPKKAMGAWIHLPVSTVTVPARSGEVIPFTFDPPANVAPGDYPGGIVAEETEGSVTGSGNLKVRSLEAVATAVYGRVVGPLHPRLVVTKTSVTKTSPFASEFGGPVDAMVTYSITNTGNEDLTPKITVSLAPLVGSGSTAHTKLSELFPGSTVTFTQKFDHITPFGFLTAKVLVSTAKIRATGSAGAVVVPWGLVVIVLLLLVVAFWRVRRKRRPRGTRDVGAGSSDAAGTDGAADGRVVAAPSGAKG
jgi:hypothetical protein